jgi:heterodisulfide reductase subunit B
MDKKATYAWLGDCTKCQHFEECVDPNLQEKYSYKDEYGCCPVEIVEKHPKFTLVDYKLDASNLTKSQKQLMDIVFEADHIHHETEEILEHINLRLHNENLPESAINNGFLLGFVYGRLHQCCG